LEARLVEIKELSTNKVRFYSVKLGSDTVTEFSKFQEKMAIESINKAELTEINLLLKRISKIEGAQEWLFRDEFSAEALPPRWPRFIEINETNDFGIRLYCVRLSTGIVILLNGDRKTAQNPKNCKKCYPHFKIAVSISNQINKAIEEQQCELDHISNEILLEDDFELII
jgi:hypothetical protein